MTVARPIGCRFGKWPYVARSAAAEVREVGVEMSVSRKEPSDAQGSGTRPRRVGKSPGRSLNRAQVQAMEARSQRTLSRPRQGAGDASAMMHHPTVPASGATGGRPSTRARNRAVARPLALTRSEEYRYIRADLQRLLVTAGALLVIMVVLLYIFER